MMRRLAIGTLSPSSFSLRWVFPNTVRWSHIFGQLAKVYSSVERRHIHGQEEAPLHGGIQEAGGA